MTELGAGEGSRREVEPRSETRVSRHTAARGVGAFAVAHVAAGFVLVVGAVLMRGGPRQLGADWAPNVVMATYGLSAQAAVNILAFGIVTCASRAWRDTRFATAVAAGLGMAAALASGSGAWLWTLRPLGAVLPATAAVTLGWALPGLLAGILAVVWARVIPHRRARRAG